MNNAGKILIGNGLNKCRIAKQKIIQFEVPVRLSDVQFDCNVYIGSYTYIRGGRIAGLKSIGRFCSIAPGLTVGDGQHPTHYLSTHPFQFKGMRFNDSPEYDEFSTLTKSIVQAELGSIGDDVWIGANVTIMRGVNIGSGAVIGAGAVVTKNVAPFEIVGGVPARTLRFRFSSEIIDRLLSLCWWNYSLASLAGIVFDDIELAINELERRKSAGLLVPCTRDKYRYRNGVLKKI